MAIYGRGLNREIVAAVNNGEIQELITVDSVRKVVELRGWVPRPTEKHIAVTLANGSSNTHSPTYKKYFVADDAGGYRLKDEYKGDRWK